MSLHLRALTETDFPAVSAIHAEGIATGNATFAEAPPTWDQFDAAMTPGLRFVATDGPAILGWVALAPTSSRPVFSGIHEVSLYVSAEARGRGVGGALLGHIIRESETAGIWTLIARIFPENAASTRLHQRHGFEIVGTHRRMGFMTYGPYAGWRDNQLLERRSTSVGV